MPAWYKIAAVESEEPRAWSSSEGGKFESWRVTLENAEGRQKQGVEMNKKPGNRPREGSEHFGELENRGEYGFQFRYAKPADGGPSTRGGSGGGGGASSNGDGGGGYYQPYAPEDLAAIRRSRALDFAVAALGPIREETSGDDYRLTLLAWAKFYEESVEGAAERAGADPEPEPEPTAVGGGEEPPPPGDDDVPF